MGIENVLNDSLSWASNTSNILTEKDGDDLMAALVTNNDTLETLSNQFLNNGITHYTEEDYEKAATAFQAAISVYPDSSYYSESVQYLSQTYLKLEDTDKAIEVYENAVTKDPTNAGFRSALAKLLYSEDRFEEAAVQYHKAVELDDNAENRYAYGEALLKLEDYNGAEEQFNKVILEEPDSTAGYYGMGKAQSLQEDYDRAIEYFEKTLDHNPEFYDAYLDIAYAYADKGDYESAWEIQETLEKYDEDLAELADEYIESVEAPKIAFAYATSSFPYKMSAGYSVSNISGYLQEANSEHGVTMKFQFTKDMDLSSVEDIFNWNITQSTSGNLAKDYNFGQKVPDTEVTLDYYPDYVIYDSDNCSATVGFTVKQNETADGTIDPCHIVFSFAGEDIYGVSMDEDADEYSGFSGVA